MQAAKKSACILVALSLAGCSDKPSNHILEQQIVQQVMGGGAHEVLADPIVKVENFEKVNGFRKDSKTYIADLKYDLVFQKSLKEIAQQMKKEEADSPFSVAIGSGGVLILKMQFGDFEAGYRVTKKEKVTFLKTEKGWRIDKEAMSKR